MTQSRQRRRALSRLRFKLEHEVKLIKRQLRSLGAILLILDERGTFVSADDGPRLVALHDPRHFDSLAVELEQYRKRAAEVGAFLTALLGPSANEASRVERFSSSVGNALPRSEDESCPEGRH